MKDGEMMDRDRQSGLIAAAAFVLLTIFSLIALVSVFIGA
jgi:hypothetical protein